MGLPGWRRLWLLGAAAAALLLADCSGSSSSNHSLKIFLAGVSEPGPDLSLFIAGAFVDDQLIAGYDSEGKRFQPQVSWMEKLEKEEPQLWHTQTMNLQASEFEFRWSLSTVRNFYNQSQGLHTLQVRNSCELIAGEPKGGHLQFAYDRRDLITFDKETLSWTAASAPAQSIEKRWEADPDVVHRLKDIMETCIECLLNHMHYGMEALQRREPPVVKVTCRTSREVGLETLLCRVHGFYPKEIDVVWRKDGVVKQEDTFRGVVSPNADGTYYTWLSIDIDPKDWSHFRCHVDHEGLLEPLDVALEESASVPLGLVVGAVLMVVVLLLLLTGIVSYIRGGKRPFASLLSKRPPPAHPASLEADLGLPPVSFQKEDAGAKLEQADQGSTP